MTVQEFYRDLAERQRSKFNKAPTGRNELIMEIAEAGLRCFDENAPVCWVGFTFPTEVVLAFDYRPFYAELVPGYLASTDAAVEAIDFVERKLGNWFSCSFHRTSIGETLRDLWPRPSAVVGVSGVCDGQVTILTLGAQRHGIEPHILELPTEFSEKTVDEVEVKLWEIVKRLEKQSGKELNENKLRTVIRDANEIRRQMLRITRLRQRIPAAFHGFPAFQLMTGVQMWATPRLPQICSRIADDAEREIETKGNIEEKFRILWLGAWPAFRTDILDILEGEFAAHIVADELSIIWYDELDEENPVRSIARKWASNVLSGSNEKRARQAVQCARDFHVDGAIHLSQWGCRQTSAGVGVLREKLAEAGVPLLNLDIDCIDSRSYSPGQVKTRLQGFMEMLSEVKQ